MKRLLLGGVVLLALLGACSSSDDDDGGAVDAADETSEPADDAVEEEPASFDLVAFCAELRESDDRPEIPVDEVQQQADYYAEQASIAEDDLAPHIQVVADATQSLVDEATGDAVTTEEIQAKAASYEGFGDAYTALEQACSGDRRSKDFAG